MRPLILVLAATSLALAGCGKKAVTGNTSAVDETVTAQDFSTNDTTAIDAATGADANMAADVDINAVELANDSSDNGKPAARRPSERGSSAAAATTNASNASTNAAAPAQTPPAAPAAQPAEANSN